MLYIVKTFHRRARAGRRELRGAAAIAIRSAVRRPLIAVAAISLAALAAIAAFEVAGFDPVSPAFAQKPTPPPVTLTGLFDNYAKLKTTEQLKDAIKKAHVECYPPRAKFTVLVPRAALGIFKESSDVGMALTSLAQAEADAVAAVLPSLGLDPGQFKTGWAWTAEGNNGVVDILNGESNAQGNSVRVSYGKFDPQDDNEKEAPKLKVTWTPTEGTKVKAGDKIKVTITASERYEDGHKSWPSGVQRIKLLADDGKVVDSKDYGRVISLCARQTFEAIYTVPLNPPPIVHLQAFAEDTVGNHDTEAAGFPTGDTCNFWVGDVMSEVTDNTRGSQTYPGTTIRRVTYHVRLREGPRPTGGSSELLDGRQVYVFEIPLINEGSSVEGSQEEEVSGPEGYRMSGRGTAKLLNPGTNFGSVGHLLITDKGERVEFRFSMEPDFESRLFSTTTRPNRGGSFESKAGFLAVPVGGSSDPQLYRRITGGGRLMEGDYTYSNVGVLGKTSWKLRAEIAPCVQPPPPDTHGPP